MATRLTYRIAELVCADASEGAYYAFEHSGRSFEVQRITVNYSVPYMRELIASLRNHVDAFVVTGLPPVMRIEGKSYVHRQHMEIMGTPSSVPICDGASVREICLLSSFIGKVRDGSVRPQDGIFFPFALYYLELVRYLNTLKDARMGFGDPFPIFGAPWIAKFDRKWVKIARATLTVAGLRDMGAFSHSGDSAFGQLARTQMLAQVKAQYGTILGGQGFLKLLDPSLDFVRDKRIVLADGLPVLGPMLSAHGASSVTDLFPERLRFHPQINYGVLDAALRLTGGFTAQLSVPEWMELLGESIVIEPELRRYVLDAQPGRQFRATKTVQVMRQKVLKRPAPDFAFIIHALSVDDLFRVPGFRWMRSMPDGWRRGFERVASRAPGFQYGRLENVVSRKNNREVNGVIYALTATPRIMKASEPEDVYRQIEGICHHAADLGAKIIGLGAYTKIVGDAGESIHRASPIPVTTGNSLSASATLWSVHDAAAKMGLLKPVPGTRIMDGTAMVIGATGSIGKVSAKLMSLICRRLVLVAPRMERLNELANEIRAIAPRCEILLTTDANDFAATTDILVTATSALDQKVVDVARLKPGAIVCDCSRPLDFTVEDAMRRPDVLIIESGEVVLPGPARLSCDIGLPDKVVYACLGETALLAMAQRYEPFTLGREIDYLKVKEIYRLAREHGVDLAAIRGHAGLITDQEIRLTRELALQRRAELGIP